MDDDVLYTADLVKALKLTKTGEWLHEGKTFSNAKLKSLFNRSMEWIEDEQKFYLRIGKGRAAFKYEDTVFFVNSIAVQGDKWLGKLSDETEEELDLESFQVGDEDQIYCTIKNTHQARLSRGAHQVLAEYVVGDNEFEVAGQKYRIKPLQT